MTLIYMLSLIFSSIFSSNSPSYFLVEEDVRVSHLRLQQNAKKIYGHRRIERTMISVFSQILSRI